MKEIIKKEIKKLEEWMKRPLNNWTKRDWSFLCHSKDISEEFIREFQDEVNWKHIYRYQKLSEDFIREFKNKIDLKIVLDRKIITQEFFNNLNKPLSRFELMDI